MLLLTTTAHPTMLEHADEHHGRLLTPRHYSMAAATAMAGIPWAADNDCFQGLDPDAYFAMLLALQASCIQASGGERRAELWRNPPLFVTVPDVVADPVGTVQGWVRWSRGVRRLGLPLAFVAQDGCIERHLVPPAHEFDCLFIGGSDAFKFGEPTRHLVRNAKRAGLWVHVGRVNSAKRIRWAAALGADSVDGTGWAVWRDANLPRGLEAAGAAGLQGVLAT